jgi:hypothetical protein
MPHKKACTGPMKTSGQSPGTDLVKEK